MSLIEELFLINKKEIQEVKEEFGGRIKTKNVSGITYSFVSCTLSQAQSFSASNGELRFITDARKSGETAGNGTGLPAFYDEGSLSWVDFLGTAITV